MILPLLKIRVLQLKRALENLGLFRFVFLLSLVIFALAYVYLQCAIDPNSYYISVVASAFIFLIHSSRGDKLFLKTHFANQKQIIFSEYLIITLPLIIAFAINLKWIQILILLVSLVIIVSFEFNPKKRSLNTKLQKLIPKSSFEWKAGIRKTFFLVIMLWFTGLFGSSFIGTVPIVIFILGIIPMNFYERCEPFQMIISYEMGSTKFLVQKIKIQFLLFSIITLPLIIAFLIFHHQNWYIPIIEYFTFISLHTYFILTKYAFYESNSKPAATQIFSAIGAISAIIPIFLPLVWVMSVYFFFKSKNNLNYYLNDFNK
jgi:hypothetical protein